MRLLAFRLGLLAPALLAATFAQAAVVYDNLATNNLMAMASGPDFPSGIRIEAADDFLLASAITITSASFVGIIAPSSAGASPTISAVGVEIYRVFPSDSNVGRTSGAPTFSTTQVPTRVNSPSDVTFDNRDGTSGLNFTTSVLATDFTALNSVQAGGIHPLPNPTTGGSGPLTGQELQFDVTFTTPFDLPAGHYFFVPLVTVTNGDFYWLSASRPISGTGTTPFSPDLQTWMRDANLSPDWLRVGTDIVGGTSPPTFNAAFALNGTTVPEPGMLALLAVGAAGLAASRRRR